LPIIIQIFAALSGIIHVCFFVMESLLWMHPKVHSRFLVQSAEEAELIRVFILNQGYYNLLLALGMFIGLFLLKRNETAGKTLVIYTSAFMLGAAAVLIISLPAMLTGAIVQGLLPLLVLGYLFKNKNQRD
jgi:putative membrane protein